MGTTGPRDTLSVINRRAVYYIYKRRYTARARRQKLFVRRGDINTGRRQIGSFSRPGPARRGAATPPGVKLLGLLFIHAHFPVISVNTSPITLVQLWFNLYPPTVYILRSYIIYVVLRAASGYGYI